MVKRYSDFTSKITADELYHGLVGYGLFTEKLPPIFDCASYLNFCLGLNHEVTPFEEKRYRYVRFEATRNINIPRTMGIPTPMAHERLCWCLKQEWNKIQKHFLDKTKGDKYSKSRIHIRKMKDTGCLFEMNYENLIDDGFPELDISLGKKYYVKTDISSCFPSTYTHSIPWALVSKTTAKKNQGNKNKWYNVIDLELRRSMDGETHGILIGPHSSNLISEIILCVIDNAMSNKWQYIRNIDDYGCYVNSESEAQEFLLELSKNLRRYGLLLNQKKTEIYELPACNQYQWVCRIREHIAILENKERLGYWDINSLLNYCVELMNINGNNTSVILYVIKTLSSEKMTTNAKMCVIKMVTSLALLRPYLIHYIDEYVYERYEDNNKRLQRHIRHFYEHYMNIGNYDAAAHAIQMAIKYGIILPNLDIQKITDSDDCILMLCAFLYCRKNLRFSTEMITLYKHALELLRQGDLDEYWLFIYECLPVKYFTNDWRRLKNAGVSFVRKGYQ